MAVEVNGICHLADYSKLAYGVVTAIEPPHDKTNKMACAPSEDSDQSGRPPQSDQSLRCPHEESLEP